MSEFRTTFQIPPAPFKMDHSTPVLLAGSCFTTHIGAQLSRLKFPTCVNPFGVIYNPVSLAQSVWPAATYAPADFFEHEGIWRHWDMHSDLARPTLDDAVAQAQATADATRRFLENTDVLLLTFGTADVFYWLENERIVANCHKKPAALFGQKRLPVETITDVLCQLVLRLRQQRPTLKVVLTVSPVRHWRSGAVENQRSKATLLLACEALCRELPDTVYFPAYELLMDDLRDYRFYTNDMLHPSETAIQYIWSRFSDTFMSPETLELNRRIEKIVTAAAHRPFNPDTPQHKTFQARQLEAIAALEKERPGMDWSAERRLLGED